MGVVQSKIWAIPKKRNHLWWVQDLPKFPDSSVWYKTRIWYHLMIFLTILFVVLISPIISRVMNNLFYSCLMVIFIWFIFVNGSVWIIGGGNLLTTYISAIPFDFKLLISTGLYLSLFHYAELIYIQFNNSDKKIIDRFI